MNFVKTLIFSAALLSFSFPNAFAQNLEEKVRPDLACRYIDLKMKEEPFKSGLTGVLAVTLDGDTLISRNSLGKMIPASNTKLISTGLAIHGLGAGYRFTTRIGYTGHISDGTLHGDLYIIGGGDPTLASGDKMAPERDSLFSMWKMALTRKGIRRINGRIIGDGRFFDGPIENDNWSYNDLGTDYGAGCNGLCFNRNIQTYRALPTSIGSPASVSVTYPQMPWMEFRNRSVTSAAGSGDNLYLFTTDLSTTAEMRGSLAIDKGERKESCSNKYGALTCAWQFAEYLKVNDIHAERVADIDNAGRIRTAPSWRKPSQKGLVVEGLAPAQEKITVIGKFLSPTIKEIAAVTNDRSDNFYAETLIRILAKERTGSASYDSCRVVIKRELDSLGVDSGYGIQMVDGSGLARHNYIAPDFFCRFLRAMSMSPAGKSYFNTLAGPGTGTMRYSMKNQAGDLRQRIKMKSGSMNGVVCFSGYILPTAKNRAEPSEGSFLPKNTIVFSIMTNNMPENESAVRRFIDRLLVILAEQCDAK